MTWSHVAEGPDRIETFETLTEARERFGENYRGFVFELTRAQVESLSSGKVLAFDIGGREYAGFLRLRPVDGEGSADEPNEDPPL